MSNILKNGFKRHIPQLRSKKKNVCRAKFIAPLLVNDYVTEGERDHKKVNSERLEILKSLTVPKDDNAQEVLALVESDDNLKHLSKFLKK